MSSFRFSSFASWQSKLFLALGDLPQALSLAKQSLEQYDQCTDEFDVLSVNLRAQLANALHQSGKTLEAEVLFCQADEMQKKLRASPPILSSLEGFYYCDLLLSQWKYQKVKKRAAKTLKREKQNGRVLFTALDSLSLGRAWLLQAQQEGGGAITQAAYFLNCAIDGFRQVGDLIYLPRGLLAREELYRLIGDYLGAQSDLNEAQRIAECSEMGLHLCDCDLEWARLWLSQGDLARAIKHWASAKEMIGRMGYHRRDAELQEIAQQLCGAN